MQQHEKIAFQLKHYSLRNRGKQACRMQQRAYNIQA